jgi:leucyl-tRNA synthetase
VLSCFAPHLAEELWHEVFLHDASITLASWPTYEESKTVSSVITLPVQANGKLRATIQIKLNDNQTQVEQQAYKDPRVINFLNGRKPKKVIYITNKILNFII